MDIKDLSGLGEPAKELVTRCFDLLGVKQRPSQIVREAQAEAEAAVIKAKAAVEVSKIEVLGGVEVTAERHRAIHRVLHQAEKEQRNIENIIFKALPQVGEGARPQEIDEDWFDNFVDKSRLVSDDEMQNLWARILAGEANRSGSFSKRTVSFLQSMEKEDAADFQNLCQFIGVANGKLKYEKLVLISGTRDPFYPKNGVTFDTLAHLQSLGLVVVGTNGYVHRWKVPLGSIRHLDTTFQFDFTRASLQEVPIGCALLSKLGEELSDLCIQTEVPGFKRHLAEWWIASQYTYGYALSVITDKK